MDRKPRIHSPNTFYHVILRGNGKQDILFEGQDRYRFYLLLQEGTERFSHKVHALCLRIKMGAGCFLTDNIIYQPVPLFLPETMVTLTPYVPVGTGLRQRAHWFSYFFVAAPFPETTSA